MATEETINEILDRYLELNTHASSYTWKRMGRELNMNATLTGNEILDETDELIELGIDVDDYIPAIHLFFNDDLTIAWAHFIISKISSRKWWVLIAR